ncbi:MAG: Ig domain-containing protein [bacterium]
MVATQSGGKGKGTTLPISATTNWSQGFGCLVNAPLLQLADSIDLVAGVPVNQQLTALGGDLPLHWSVIGAFPGAMSLDPSGALVGTPTQGISEVIIQVTDSCTDVVRTDAQFLRIRVLPASCDPLAFDTGKELASGKELDPYDADLVAQLDGRGTGKLVWSLTSDTVLPPGLALKSSGRITGVPTRDAAGLYAIGIEVHDACTFEQDEIRRFALKINP